MMTNSKPGPKPDPKPDPLATMERDWELRRAIETRHAVFQVRPSDESARALNAALEAWQSEFGAHDE